MSRGVTELEEQLAASVDVEPARIVGLAECAARLGCALRSARWLEIAATLYDRAEEPASRDVLAKLDGLPTDACLADAVTALRQAGSETRQAS
jgi:hypothetical protein